MIRPSLMSIPFRFLLVCLLVAVAINCQAATLTGQTNRLGVTPTILAYNSGHFHPGSNTRDWWHYSGVNGARVFITASIIEPSDDIAGRGDGVNDQTSFIARKIALRANPLSTNYINWPYLLNGFASVDMHGANILSVNYACSELRRTGIQILACISAGESSFPIADTNDWAGKWELWQHYYAEAFYLGREFEVQRYQVFNEPNLVSGLTVPEFLLRLQIVSDAVQSALADVNLLYGKTLVPTMCAPVSAGTADDKYAGWGQPIVAIRHQNFLGQTDPNFWLIQKYDYHQYNSTPANFGSDLAGLNNLMTSDMSPEPRFPTAISEFNVHTASTFNTLTETLDSPTKYARFGSIVVNLVKNFCDELYVFKFSQTLYSATVPIKKNGMLFVDNTNAPYNIGGITKAGEVWRLFTQTAAPGRDRMNVTLGSGASGLDVTATYDPISKYYSVFSCNDSTSVGVDLDVSAWNVPAGQRVLLQEVSETSHAGVAAIGTVSNNVILGGTQAANTVWDFTIPTKPQEPLQTVFATANAMVKDGSNRLANYASNAVCEVRNSSTNASVRSVSFLKFHLPVIYAPDIQMAVLAVQASSINGTAPVQAHVYGITATNWSPGALTWSNAPNLAQGVPAGSDYTNNSVLGGGDSAQMVGQLVAGASPGDRLIDVTRYLRGLPGRDAAFMLAREVRFFGDIQDDDGIKITSREADPTNGPRLLIVRLKDTDHDGLSDEAEVNFFGTDPNNADTDGDGVNDGEEVLILGTNAGGTNAPVAVTISTQPTSQTVTVGGSATFSVTASGTPPLAYQWRYNGTSISGATNPSLSLAGVQSTQAGTYSVIVTNGAGSMTSSTALLTVQAIVTTALPRYDAFAYAEGTDLADQGGWQLNGGASGTIEAGSLDTGTLADTSGNRLAWGGPTMSLRLPLGTNITSGEVYFSFLLRVDSLGSSFTSVGTLAGFTTGTGTTFATKVNIQTNGTGGFTLGTSKAAGTTYGGWAAPDFNPGQTIFVVGRYTFKSATGTDDLSDLWINPTPQTFGNATSPTASIASVGAGGSDLSQIDRFFFRSGGAASSPSKLVADELRVGRTWADVTPIARPVLALSATGGNIILRWPTNAAGFNLQSSSDVSPSPVWSPLSIIPTVSGTNQTVVVGMTNATRYFRLAR